MTHPSSSLRGGRNRKFKSEINVVPYIDVMLVLLVIFMVAAPLTNPSVIDLPTAGKSTQPPTEYIHITLKPDTTATIGIGGQKHGAGEAEPASGRADLVRRLRTMHRDAPDMPIMISADKDIPYGEVIATVSEARKLGFARVGLATK
jgi:biopolymer transport protein TolR